MNHDSMNMNHLKQLSLPRSQFAIAASLLQSTYPTLHSQNSILTPVMLLIAKYRLCLVGASI